MWKSSGRCLDGSEVLITTEQLLRVKMKEFKRLAKVSPNWEVKKRNKQMIKNGKTDSILESIAVDIGYSGDPAGSSSRSRK